MNLTCGRWVMVAGLAVTSAAMAQPVAYERATLGTTGQTSGGGLSVSNDFYTGWRFQVTGGPVTTTRLGGHFHQGNGTVFGAIVALTGPNDNPDSFDLTSPDVLGTTLVSMGVAGCSCEHSAPISLTLNDGWYLVIFGTGRFGAPSGSQGLFAQDPATAVPGAQLNVTYRQATHPSGQLGPILQGSVARVFVEGVLGAACYPNCDQSTGSPVLTANDFSCFLTRFVNGESYADCDGVGGLTANDFSCFLTKYTAGCS